MKRDWKQNPYVVVGLLLVAALVWGILLLSVQAHDGATVTASATEVDVHSEEQAQHADLPFPDLSRDPFAPLAADNVTEDDPTEEPSRPSRIHHRLQGVIGGTALLLDPEGSTHVVRNGDTIGELEILRIHAGHVEVRLNGHRAELSLD